MKYSKSILDIGESGMILIYSRLDINLINIMEVVRIS